jgi:hypothetical protein
MRDILRKQGRVRRAKETCGRDGKEIGTKGRNKGTKGTRKGRNMVRN